VKREFCQIFAVSLDSDQKNLIKFGRWRNIHGHFEKARREGESTPGFFCAFLPFPADCDKIRFLFSTLIFEQEGQ